MKGIDDMTRHYLWSFRRALTMAAALTALAVITQLPSAAAITATTVLGVR
jgi:hypothetical protein